MSLIETEKDQLAGPQRLEQLPPPPFVLSEHDEPEEIDAQLPVVDIVPDSLEIEPSFLTSARALAESSGDSPMARSRLAQAEMAVGNQGEATRCAVEALELPDAAADNSAVFSAVRTLMAAGNGERAEELLGRFAKPGPLSTLYATLAAQRGDLDAAFDRLDDDSSTPGSYAGGSPCGNSTSTKPFASTAKQCAPESRDPRSSPILDLPMLPLELRRGRSLRPKGRLRLDRFSGSASPSIWWRSSSPLALPMRRYASFGGFRANIRRTLRSSSLRHTGHLPLEMRTGPSGGFATPAAHFGASPRRSSRLSFSPTVPTSSMRGEISPARRPIRSSGR